jgi:hypothetical protein
MDFNPKKDIDNIDIDENDQDEIKKSRCFIICLIILIVLMLPSTMALLAIF